VLPAGPNFVRIFIATAQLTGRSLTGVYRTNYLNKNICYKLFIIPKNIRILESVIVFIKLHFIDADYFYHRQNEVIAASAAFFSKMYNKKMVLAISHDRDLFPEKEFCNVILKLQKKKFFKKYIKLVYQYFIYKMKTYALNHASIIVCQTNYQYNNLPNARKKSATIIPNSFCHFNESNKHKKKNIILWIGNFWDYKRPDIFIKLSNELVLDQWQFVMIGDPRSYNFEQESVANDNFTFLGQLGFEETEHWFSKAKIIINTSSEEGFSNTFIQAWYHKLLLISLKVDPDKLLSKHKLGLCAYDDFSKLIELTHKATSELEQFSEYIENGFQYANNTFNLEKNFHKLHETLLSS
jgi:glycosyltransferase involved in cell wall biosynthesis